jgi:hypothetical protein
MSYQFQTNNADETTPTQFVPYTPEPYTYLRSSVPNENTEKAYVWVANELYEFLLVNPLITKTIYESKDRSAYLSLVEFFVKRLPQGYYDSDFFHDWTLNGENNGFMRQIRSAYSEYQKICEKFAPKKM